MGLLQRTNAQKSLLFAVQATEIIFRCQRFTTLWQTSEHESLMLQLDFNLVTTLNSCLSIPRQMAAYTYVLPGHGKFKGSFRGKILILQLYVEIYSSSALLIISLHSFFFFICVSCDGCIPSSGFQFSFPYTFWLLIENTRTVGCVTHRGSLGLLPTTPGDS